MSTYLISRPIRERARMIVFVFVCVCVCMCVCVCVCVRACVCVRVSFFLPCFLLYYSFSLRRQINQFLRYHLNHNPHLISIFQSIFLHAKESRRFELFLHLLLHASIFWLFFSSSPHWESVTKTFTTRHDFSFFHFCASSVFFSRSKKTGQIWF